MISLSLTSAVGEVAVAGGAQAGAPRVARGEVGESVGSADGLDVVHVALAAKVAGGREVDLEGLAVVVAGSKKKNKGVRITMTNAKGIEFQK